MSKKFLIVAALLVLSFVIYQCTVPRKAAVATTTQPPLQRDSSGKIVVIPNPDPAYRSIEESMRSIYLPEGYRLQLVASEPMVREPVAIVWDGNGAMYVAEMLTYMQDVDATGENEPVSRISRLEDTDGDGMMDKSTVFIDSLLLPRMLLCVGNKLLVSETYDLNIYAYTDTDNDGVADHKEIVFENPRRNNNNLEHQRSGLVWNLDNYIYVTVENVRYKYRNGKLIADTTGYGPFQWGLGHDNYGRLFYSSAGGEIGAFGFQVNPLYGLYNAPGQLADNFQAVWPIIATPDVQGGVRRLRPDSTLNHFTGACGQSIFRGDALPDDLRGDLLVCEPVGRLIRRAKVTSENGKRVLRNAYHEEEFIASTDMNFRPVNTATGPDGCLYIVDMHRGIIQEGNWTREGSFLRPQIVSKGLDKNVSSGRIYRVVHDGYTPGSRPDILKADGQRLLSYLSHSNGWWRDNAQKEIIVRNDRSLVPALLQMAKGHENHLTRIHALWTLQGLEAINRNILAEAFHDAHPQVRKTAVTMSEFYLRRHDTEIIKLLSTLADDRDPDVQIQLTASLAQYPYPASAELLQRLLKKATPAADLLADVVGTIENNRNVRLYGQAIAKLPEEERKIILEGRQVFMETCANCHGGDGKGISVNGAPMPAPPFVGSKRMNDNATLINILLHGLTGPLDGQEYTDIMAPFGAVNSDEWVANVVSYLNFNFGDNKNEKYKVSASEVKALREKHAGRKALWTMEELMQKNQPAHGGSTSTTSGKAVAGIADKKSGAPAPGRSAQKPATPAATQRSAVPVPTRSAQKPAGGTADKKLAAAAPSRATKVAAGEAVLQGKELIAGSDCIACHRETVKLVGPSYTDIAAKYAHTDANIAMLAGKILSGGSGNWGEVAMTPHPTLTKAEATKIVQYIFSLAPHRK